VTKIIGESRIEKIVIQKVDNFVPIDGTEIEFEVDALLLSVGLIPENGLSEAAGIILDPKTKGPIVSESYETNIEGIFACGNVLHVHDLVDFVTEESKKAGQAVIKYLDNKLVTSKKSIQMIACEGVNYIVPQHVTLENVEENIEFFLRVKKEYKNVAFVVKSNNIIIKTIKTKHLVPAEMEKIKLNVKDFASIKDSISISVEEVL
ncbi:MAG: FAD-dependent oxidoreductase, partial [Candidatus Izemoplasma sp.]